MNAGLVINPVAGKRRTGSIRIAEDMIRERASCTTCVTEKRGDAFEFAKRIEDADILIVAGGDGTCNEVINGLLCSGKKKDIPLALVPIGTTNVLARELGIPGDVKKAVHLALTGVPAKISLGRINGRYFSLMAGIGFDGETVFKTRNSIKRVSGKGAFILTGITLLKHYRPSLIQVRTQKEIFTGFTAVVGNARYYGGRFMVTPKADITEPLLDLCLLKSKSRKSLLRFISGVMLNRHLQHNDVIYRRIRSAEITSRDVVHVQVDGDYFGTLPASIDVVGDAISVIR